MLKPPSVFVATAAETIFSVTDLLRDPERKLTEDQAAMAIGIKAQTLAVWRTTKRYGLPFIKAGRAVRYRAGDVAKWIDQQTVRPTSTN